MKLVSVWVEKYMSLHDLGINLGDEHFFKYYFDSTSRSLTVEVEKTKNYFNFFSKSSLKNVTGILGNNGAGKTSFLKLLNLFESKSPIEFSAVIILKDEAKNKYHCVNYANFLKRNKLNLDKHPSITNLLGTDGFEIKETDTPFREVDILFYSNLYSDHNDRYLKTDNNLNRSVDYVTRQCLSYSAIGEYLKDHEKKPEDSLGKEAQFNILKLYFDERFRRLLSFISMIKLEHPSLENLIKQIPFPEYVSLNFREDLFEYVNNLIERSIYDFKRLREIIPFVLRYLENEKNISLRFRNELIFKLFLYAFKEDLFKSTKPNTPLSELEIFVKGLLLDVNMFDKINAYMMSKTNENMFYQVSKLNTVLKNLENGNYNIKIDEDRILSLYNFKIEVKKETWQFIKDINSLFEIDPEPLISFRWHSLSAGQEAILNQFMELYEGLKHVQKANLLINIDEGELYLHPEWQRQYLDLLISFLEYFIEKSDVIESSQLLVTSHSPFIASDIPQFNLVFLYREESSDGNERSKVKVISSQEHQATFGGNIFDLYKDSFFIKDFFGVFASNWIKEAFKKANGEQSKLSDSDFSKMLKLIGEKVIHDVLENNYNLQKDDSIEIIDLEEIAKDKLKEEKNVKKNTKAKKKKGKQ